MTPLPGRRFCSTPDDVLRARNRAYPAERRAAAISERLEALARNKSFRPGSIRAVELPNLTRLEFDGKLLMNILEADSQMQGAARSFLTPIYIARIEEAVAMYREARTAKALWRSAAIAFLWTAAFLLAILAVRWLFRRGEARMERALRESAEKGRARTAGLIDAEGLIGSANNLLRFLRGVLLLLAGLAYLEIVLSQFPWTRGFAAQIFELVLSPLRTIMAGVARSIPDLTFVAVLALVLRWAVRLMRLVFDAIGRGSLQIKEFEPEWAEPTFRILRLLVIAFGVVVAYPYLPGSNSEAFKGVSLFIGVIFSLGSTGFISNMVAGYSLTYRRAYRVGDRVKIGDIVGDVEKIRIQVTHLRSLKNEEIILPNSTVVNSHVTNYTSLARKRGLILHTTVGIGYETPWRQVEAMLLLAASRTSGLMKEPPPFVMQKSLGDFCVVYELNVYCDQPARQMQFYTELHRNIQDVFNEYGVQIMTPNYEMDPAEAKVVPKDKWFEAPARPEPAGEA